MAIARTGPATIAARTPVVKVTLPALPVGLGLGSAVPLAEFEAPAAVSLPVMLEAPVEAWLSVLVVVLSKVLVTVVV